MVFAHIPYHLTHMDLSPLLAQTKGACTRAGYTKAETLIKLMESRLEEARRAERAEKDSLLYAEQQTLTAQHTLEKLRVYNTVAEAETDVDNTYAVLEDLARDVGLGLTLREAIDRLSSLQQSAALLRSDMTRLHTTEHSLQDTATNLLEHEAGALLSSPFLVSSRVSSGTLCEATRTTAALELLHNTLTRLRASRGEQFGKLEEQLAEDLTLIKEVFSTSFAALSRRLSAYGQGETRQQLLTQGRRVRRAEGEAQDVAALLASLASS